MVYARIYIRSGIGLWLSKPGLEYREKKFHPGFAGLCYFWLWRKPDQFSGQPANGYSPFWAGDGLFVQFDSLCAVWTFPHRVFSQLLASYSHWAESSFRKFSFHL